jgi:hypothetical protein
MSDEPVGIAGEERFARPSPELRERVLRSCREAMAERRATDRRRQQWRRWSLVAGAACLLLVNAVAEQQHAARIGALIGGSARVARGPARSSPAALKLFRARAVLLVALRHDPDAL